MSALSNLTPEVIETLSKLSPEQINVLLNHQKIESDNRTDKINKIKKLLNYVYSKCHAQNNVYVDDNICDSSYGRRRIPNDRYRSYDFKNIYKYLDYLTTYCIDTSIRSEISSVKAYAQAVFIGYYYDVFHEKSGSSDVYQLDEFIEQLKELGQLLYELDENIYVIPKNYKKSTFNNMLYPDYTNADILTDEEVDNYSYFNTDYFADIYDDNYIQSSNKKVEENIFSFRSVVNPLYFGGYIYIIYKNNGNLKACYMIKIDIDALLDKTEQEGFNRIIILNPQMIKRMNQLNILQKISVK